MADDLDWQGKTGAAWADMSHETDRAFANLTQHMLDRIAGLAGSAILDIGCGAGELSLALARARPHAEVLGIDLSPDLVAAARSRGAQRGNVTFVETNAATWQGDGFSPDLLVSRHGVMFFADPVAAFGHLRGQASPGAALFFSCFRSQRENSWIGLLRDLVPAEPEASPADPHAPGPFAFADPHHVEEVLASAGWSGVRLEPFDFAYVAGMGEDAVEQAVRFFSRIGPSARLLARFDGDEREALKLRMRARLESHCEDGIVAFPAAAWLVSAYNG
jgi:trans-aconitate methyltransferase